MYTIGMTNKSVNAPQKRERRDRTEEILKTATRMFSEKGYRGTSLASIAEKVGLTEPGLLHYFPSKVKLLQGVLKYRDDEEMKRYLPMVNLDDLELSKILGILEQLVAENQKKPTLIKLFTVMVAESIRLDHPAHEHFVDRYNTARKTYGEVFRQLQDAGQIRADVDPDQLGTLMIALLDGLQVQWLLDPDDVSMTKSFEIFSNLLSDYLE